MIKRKYLMIVILLLVSFILFGSLFSTMTKAQTVYKDSVAVTLLDLPNPAHGELKVLSNMHINLPFVFTPKADFLNVTDAWITVITEVSPAGSARFNLTVNGASMWSYWHSEPLPNHDSEHLDADLYETITSGINVVTISKPEYESSGWQPTNLFLYQAFIFVEYEYQAETQGLGVGGFWIPVDKLSLVAPYIALVSTIILAVSISVAIIKYRKKQ